MSAAFLTNTEILKSCLRQAQQAAEVIRLPLRHKVWSGGTGDFSGRGTGSSLDFDDHRTYQAGDDPRHINWQAYARTGQYSLKLYREEVRPIIDLVIDASGSTFFDPAKAARAVEVAYFCAESALQAAASLQVYLVKGNWHRQVPVDVLRSHAWTKLLPTEAETYPPAMPAIPQIPLRAQSLRLLVSDLLFPGSPEMITRAMTIRQGRAILFAPYCKAESDVQWEGNYEFVDAESQTIHPRRVENKQVQRYRQAYTRHFSLWSSSARKYGAALCRISAEASLPTALRAEAVTMGILEM
jgi:hypothetical protein